MTRHHPERVPDDGPDQPRERQTVPPQPRPGQPHQVRAAERQRPGQPAEAPPAGGGTHGGGDGGIHPDGTQSHGEAGYREAPSQPWSPGVQDVPGFPEASGCPGTPAYPQAPGYQPEPGQPGIPGYDMPGYGPPGGHPAMPDHQPEPGYHGVDATPGGSIRSYFGYARPGSRSPGEVAGSRPGSEEAAAGEGGPGPSSSTDPGAAPDGKARGWFENAGTGGQPAADGGTAPGGPTDGPSTPGAGTVDGGTVSSHRRLAVLAYLAVPFFAFLVPLAIYLAALRRSRWLREHAAQACNTWVTFVLYAFSLGIMGLMLALDTPQVGITAGVTAVALLWVVTVVFLARAAYAASRGRRRTLPHWLCSHLFR
jgi:uncharacterized Tic20 family protein